MLRKAALQLPNLLGKGKVTHSRKLFRSGESYKRSNDPGVERPERGAAQSAGVWRVRSKSLLDRAAQHLGVETRAQAILLDFEVVPRLKIEPEAL